MAERTHVPRRPFRKIGLSNGIIGNEEGKVFKTNYCIGQLHIRGGVFTGWEHCHIQKGVLELREGGGQSPNLWVGGVKSPKLY